MGDRLATIDMGQKVGGGLLCPFCQVELGLHLTQCGLAEAYLRAKWHLDSSSHLATMDIDQKLGWEAVLPFWGAGYPSNTVAWAEAYLYAKFHLDPSNCLDTIHRRYK